MAKKVEIYTTPSCHYCHMAKDFFGQNNIKYTEYNVGLDATRREEMVEKSGQMGVPVIVVKNEEDDEEIVVGFDKASLSSLLGL